MQHYSYYSPDIEMDIRRYLRGMTDEAIWAMYEPSGIGRGHELVAQEVMLRVRLDAMVKREAQQTTKQMELFNGY